MGTLEINGFPCRQGTEKLSPTSEALLDLLKPELCSWNRNATLARRAVRWMRMSCVTVPRSMAVRYAWSGNRRWANLFNKDGLPAISFRTDTW